MDFFDSPQPTFILGVKLGNIPDNLIETAVFLTRQANATLRVVHFCEPWASASWISAYPEGGASIDMARYAEMRYLEETQTSMNGFVSTLPRDVRLESQVIFGNPIDGLIDEAKEHRASLIFCGAKSHDSKFFLSGFSTAVGLMAASSRPVMVVPDAAQWKEKETYTILICDDLSAEGEAVIRAATRFGGTLKKVRYVHLHVCNVEEEELENMADYVAEAMFTGIVRHDPHYSPRFALKDAIKHAAIVLRERFMTQGEAPDAPYEARCVGGPVVQAILKQEEEWDVDFTALGHHEMLHPKPFHLGKVPFRSMVGLQRPVLLVPREKVK